MSYFNSYGMSAGPIRINSTWIDTKLDTVTTIGEIVEKDGQQVPITQDTLYLTINNRNPFQIGDPVSYRPILAGTPILGTYEKENENKETVIYSFAPGNAVATVEWVMAYATLAPGKLGFDPSDFIRADQFSKLEHRVTLVENTTKDLIELTTKHTGEIDNLNSRVNNNEDNIKVHANRIKKIHNWIVGNTNEDYEEAYPTSYILKCGNASSFKYWGDS